MKQVLPHSKWNISVGILLSVRFEALKTIIMKIAVSWDIKSRSVDICKCFGGNICLPLQSKAVNLTGMYV
jgi:hypothetical protein